MSERDETLKIGDTVMWRDGWGHDPPCKAVVVGITLTERPREKHGHEVEEVYWTTVKENRAVVSLNNGKWAYGEQIEQITEHGTH